MKSYNRSVSAAVVYIQGLIDQGDLEGILSGAHDNDVIPGLDMTVGQVLESYQNGCVQTGAHDPIAIARGVASYFPTEAEQKVQHQASMAPGQDPFDGAPSVQNPFTTREFTEHLIASVTREEAKAQVGAIGNVLQDANPGMTADQALESYQKGCEQTGAHDPIAIARGVVSCFPTEAEQKAQHQTSMTPGQDPFDGMPSVQNPFTTQESVTRTLAARSEVKAQLGAVRHVLQDAKLADRAVNLVRAGTGAMVLTGTTYIIAERLDNNRGGRDNAASDAICMLLVLRSFPILLPILISAADAPAEAVGPVIVVTGAAIVGQYAVRRLFASTAAAPAAAGPVVPAARLSCTLL